jgi:hypothetical protein
LRSTALASAMTYLLARPTQSLPKDKQQTRSLRTDTRPF